MLNEVQRWIDDSKYDNWELYFLLGVSFISLSIYWDIKFVTTWLQRLDTVVFAYGITFGEVVIAALQGVIIGMIGWRLFSHGDRYFKTVTSDFAGKEMAFIMKIGVMTLVGVLIGLVIPEVVESYAEYVVLQTSGIVILLGYALIHVEIQNWRFWNELPVIMASGLLTAVPIFS